jgi:hypothetical protein
MKIRSVSYNNRKKAFEVRTPRQVLPFPYSKAHPEPGAEDRLVRVELDRDLGNEGFSYQLESGKKGIVHVEQVLEYNQDPAYMRDALLYRLTLEAQKRAKSSRLSRREIIRRLGTSPAQFYRLLDQTNTRKSIDKMLALLQILDCEVDLIVKTKEGSGKDAA